MARIVPGDSAIGVWLRLTRAGGETTGGKEGLDLVGSCWGREMASSSSLIAELMLNGSCGRERRPLHAAGL